jgi:hypothetical protein
MELLRTRRSRTRHCAGCCAGSAPFGNVIARRNVVSGWRNRLRRSTPLRRIAPRNGDPVSKRRDRRRAGSTARTPGGSKPTPWRRAYPSRAGKSRHIAAEPSPSCRTTRVRSDGVGLSMSRPLDIESIKGENDHGEDSVLERLLAWALSALGLPPGADLAARRSDSKVSSTVRPVVSIARSAFA